MLQTDSNTTAPATFFRRELARLGPDQPPSSWRLDESQAYCRQWAKRSYENFTVVSRLLPRRLRQDFYNVYAYCRWADNLADEVGDPKESLRLLDWWQQQLRLCYSGRPSQPVMVALQDTIQRHHLPIEPFCDLLSAFRQDQTVLRYDSEVELLDYCCRSANPVGQILLQLAGANDGENQRLSDRICTALQITNFCQDVARDAASNRVYVPRMLYEKFGVSESMLLEARPNEGLRRMLAEWVSQTRLQFLSGWPLVNRVPPWLAADIDLFVRGGWAVLDAIERQQFDVWTRRPTLTKVQKATLFCSSFFGRLVGQRGPRHA